MRIRHLHLKNFRCFDDFDIEFHPNLTVIHAPNAAGKTTVLDAAAIALGTFVGAFDFGKARHIRNEDAMRIGGHHAETEQAFPVVIAAALELGDADHAIKVVRKLTGPKSKTTIKEAAPLTEYGRDLMNQVRKQQDITLPMVAFFGTGRLWLEHRIVKTKSILTQSRSKGYEDTLSTASNFKHLQNWFAQVSLATIQAQQLGTPDYGLLERLKAIRQAVHNVLEPEGFHNFHYSLVEETLSMMDSENRILPVSELSDGVRAMISLTADLAWRCVKLNPHLSGSAPQETPGIALIDEVDLHLHPTWQQRVIKALRESFPLVQFIVTTHSPQVMSTVEKNSIRRLERVWEEDSERYCYRAIMPDNQSQGISSAKILTWEMKTDPEPQIPIRQNLSRLIQLIESDQSDSAEAKKLEADLIEHFGADHPEIQETERLKRLQKFKTRLKNSDAREA